MHTETFLTVRPSLYDNIRTLDRSSGDSRIFAPAAYARVRSAQIVPIVYIEVLSVARWFPLCWQIVDGMTNFVALRSLFDDGARQLAGSGSMAALPLALRAYPFVVGAGRPTDTHLLDTDIPDRPSDVGAPIMTASGKASAGALLKLRAKAAFDEALPQTQAMTKALVANNLLEPWPLDFEIGGKIVSVPNLLVLRQGEATSPAMFQFMEAFGAPAAILLGAHRISLFRAGILFQAARNAPQGEH